MPLRAFFRPEKHTAGNMPSPNQPIVLFHLPGGRAVRIAWLLEELHLPYVIEQSPRTSTYASPDDFKRNIGGLGRVPTIHDGEIKLQESGAITEYGEKINSRKHIPLTPK